jgi:hypothetical protein
VTLIKATISKAGIDRLEFLTEQIVEIDRRRNGRGTRNKGRVSPTNLFPRAYTADTLTRLLLIIRRKTMIATRMSMRTKMSTTTETVFLCTGLLSISSARIFLFEKFVDFKLH